MIVLNVLLTALVLFPEIPGGEKRLHDQMKTV